MTSRSSPLVHSGNVIINIPTPRLLPSSATWTFICNKSKTYRSPSSYHPPPPRSPPSPLSPSPKDFVTTVIQVTRAPAALSHPAVNVMLPPYSTTFLSINNYVLISPLLVQPHPHTTNDNQSLVDRLAVFPTQMFNSVADVLCISVSCEVWPIKNMDVRAGLVNSAKSRLRTKLS